uniref:Uncharacterized protein AlNc14C170G7981 n=1 Tax=Albugo laibachii Nc14 TaxID=890382 RepID=F0WNF6_9STRA|nr:conserved hypothetical protein [Albugo laibachii Nc14]|eukprot:CCA22847.1 conserved hypothetical protein [Albugo laibachii Nc14]
MAWITEIRASQSQHTCKVVNSNLSSESTHVWPTFIKDTRNQRNKVSKTRREERKRVKLKKLSKSFTDTWIEDILARPLSTDSKLVEALCFAGIPKELRGRVWGWLLGNKLQINEELFIICKDRAEAVRSEIALQKEVDAIMKLSAGLSALATQSTDFSEDEADDTKASSSTTRLSTPCLTASENEEIDMIRLPPPTETLQNLAGVAEKLVATCERSVWLVDVDIHRTFAYHPMFQEGGHGAERTREVLHAYICYRPDLGYVQGLNCKDLTHPKFADSTLLFLTGMSYLAAAICLHMDTFPAFKALSALMSTNLLFDMFRLQERRTFHYINVFDRILKYEVPDIHAYFQSSGIDVQMYAVDWYVS